MRTRKTITSRFAVCVENTGFAASLELNKVYRIVSDAAAEQERQLRLIDESGDDYLYPAEMFVLIRVPGNTGRTLKKSLSRKLHRAG